MKQIKTFMKRADDWVQFDAEVNKAIAEGWTLVKRDVLRPYEGPTRIFHRMLYAELERETVEVKQAEERNCETCAHFNKSLRHSPCCNCEDVNNVPTLWEPRT